MQILPFAANTMYQYILQPVVALALLLPVMRSEAFRRQSPSVFGGKDIQFKSVNLVTLVKKALASFLVHSVRRFRATL